jgi:hypothetical protein
VRLMFVAEVGGYLARPGPAFNGRFSALAEGSYDLPWLPATWYARLWSPEGTLPIASCPARRSESRPDPAVPSGTRMAKNGPRVGNSTPFWLLVKFGFLGDA